MAVAESAAQADKRSVCVIRTTVDNISTDTERHADLSSTAKPLVEIMRAYRQTYRHTDRHADHD